MYLQQLKCVILCILFNIDVVPLAQIMESYISYHTYADDTQLYIAVSCTEVYVTFTQLNSKTLNSPLE